MFDRFKRAMRSFFGFFVSSIEDPELILEQNIRDMNDQVPKMNESIAMVRANVTLLEHGTGGLLTGIKGGVPLFFDGVFVGGLGIAGGTPDQDAVIAAATLASLGADEIGA